MSHVGFVPPKPQRFDDPLRRIRYEVYRDPQHAVSNGDARMMLERIRDLDVFQRVAGECPMGCGRTLFVGGGGHVTCSWVRCPNPAAADELLHGDKVPDA